VDTVLTSVRHCFQGLGKTITAVAVILKMRGCVARAPPEAEVLWGIDSHGSKAPYYLETQEGEWF
jgi:hypothetical protein